MNIDVDVCNVPQYGVCAYECVTWVDYLSKILQFRRFHYRYVIPKFYILGRLD